MIVRDDDITEARKCALSARLLIEMASNELKTGDSDAGFDHLTQAQTARPHLPSWKPSTISTFQRGCIHE